MFAKPFVAAMDDHTDGVWCTAINPKSLTQFVSGACDGEMRVWDLSLQKSVWSGYVHEGYVRGVTVSRDGQNYFSCGDDKLIKQYGQTNSANLIWKSKNNINIGKDTADKLFKLLEVLEDNDDVQVVSSNFEVDDNVLSSLTA